jgi:hypothetical protein
MGPDVSWGTITVRSLKEGHPFPGQGETPLKVMVTEVGVVSDLQPAASVYGSPDEQTHSALTPPTINIKSNKIINPLFIKHLLQKILHKTL